VESDGRTVRFVLEERADEAAERARVGRFVAAMTHGHRAVPRRTLARRRSGERRFEPDAFEALRRKGWVVPMGSGRVSLRGPALALAHTLDEDARHIAEGLGALEEAHPALLPTSLLARCGYFGSFPHAASLVAHLIEEHDAISDFGARNAGATEIVQPDARSVAPYAACLSPALCYAVYASRESTRVGGLEAVTCAGRCFRYESRNMAGLERLWEFGMREVVFIGDAERVASARARALDAILSQLERWELDGSIESANDPFFPAARAERAWWQRTGERKLELRLDLERAGGGSRNVACASLNQHDEFFGSTFGIETADGAPASTACVGWGTERWALACFTQHGLSPEGWPRWLADRVFA
jgi:seryl-tRNA synthetase